jgi:hypothetical protein
MLVFLQLNGICNISTIAFSAVSWSRLNSRHLAVAEAVAIVFLGV